MAKSRNWLLVDGDFYVDAVSRTVILETTDIEGIKAQVPVCEILGKESLEYKHDDKKKADKRFIQNARIINKSLDMLNLLKKINKILTHDEISDSDKEKIKNDISNILKYVNSIKNIGELETEKFMNRRTDHYGRI